MPPEPAPSTWWAASGSFGRRRALSGSPRRSPNIARRWLTTPGTAKYFGVLGRVETADRGTSAFEI
eukprot:15484696-Alexandrium_andersonii.AAC.1